MFIAPATQRSLRSGGAKCLNFLDIDGAPSEREALINQNYKHLAAPAAMAPTITANFRNRTLDTMLDKFQLASEIGSDRKPFY